MPTNLEYSFGEFPARTVRRACGKKKKQKTSIMKKVFGFILPLLFGTLFSSAQNVGYTIKGTVTNKSSGRPLAGVSIITIPGNKGVMTDINGNYTIEVAAQDVELQFSNVGFIPQTIKLKNEAQLNVELTEDMQSLNEVVVVGYGTQRKKDLTGAVSVVDVKEINKKSVATLDQALQGQVAGVDVTSNSGSPGSSMMVRIRGIGTLNNSDPLFVVDGMMTGDINFLNSNDVESIQVLKDASATAIYGSRGANGVVIITTKKGKKGNALISLNTYYGIQNPWKSSNVMDGPTWASLRNEALVAAGYSPVIADPAAQPTYDYFKDITHANAPMYNFNLSVSGATDKGDYFLSADKFSQDGILNKTGFKRLTFRSNASYNIRPWLKIGENLTMAKTNHTSQYENDEWTSMLITAFTRDPVTPVKDENGKFNKAIYSDVWNPAATIEYTNDKSINYRTIGDVYAHFTLLKNLVLKSDYQFEYSFGEADSYTPVYYVFGMQKNDVSKLGKYNSGFFIRQWSNTLNYDTKFGKHNVSAMIGVETYASDYKWNSINVNNVPSDNPDVRFIDNALGKNGAVVGGSMSQLRLLSGLARLNYSYKDRYLFTSNFRADGSSKFLNSKNKWGYFPSFSAGWKISEEPFMQAVQFISNLKLRAGWGQIGNEGSVAPYQYVTSASPGTNYVWGGTLIPGFAFKGTGNPELKWETSATTNMGLDFGFFTGKLSGSVDYFIKKTTGMLLAVPIPGQTGIELAPFQNAGSMQNKGLEVSLLYRNTVGDFSYALGGNFTKIINKVLSLGANNGVIDGASFANSFYVTRTIVGQPIAQFYGYKTDGLFQNWNEVNAQTAQQNVAPGDVRYITDKDGKLALFFLGSPLPKFTYAFNTNFGYKGIDLSIALQGVYGNKIFNGPATYTKASSGFYNMSRDMINRWRGEGTQTDAHYPRLVSNDVNNGLYSDRFLEDGSYLRFKTVQLGYNLPPALLKRISVQGLRIYVNAQNLLTFTKYTGMDPEIGMRNGDPLDVGVDRGFYPSARMYSVGLNLTF